MNYRFKKEKEILSYIKHMFYFESYIPKCWIKSIESLPTLLKPHWIQNLDSRYILDLKGTLIVVICK